MDIKKVNFFAENSPPYLADEDMFFFPSSQSSVWNGLSFATPPLSPVDTSISDKEVVTHLSSVSEVLPEELFSNARDIGYGRARSPAILNDIMWNDGHRAKRPDSAMDIDVRFHLNSTPIAFEQSIANTFVDSDELYLFSLFDSYEDNIPSRHDDCKAMVTSPFQDLSDSDEEIDVVSIQTVSPHQGNNKQQMKNIAAKPTGAVEQNSKTKEGGSTRLKSNDKKEESSGYESDCENTRISHNDLERKRRNELRNRFAYLRESIPSLINNEKTAKITILRKAHELIISLEKDEKKRIAEKDLERQKNAILLRKIAKLTRASKSSR